MKSKEHWEKVYGTKSTTEVSWFQEHADLSLKLIKDANAPSTAAIIDVGGGASVLVDDLLANDYKDITVLDLSGTAITTAKSRLGHTAVDNEKESHLTPGGKVQKFVYCFCRKAEN